MKTIAWLISGSLCLTACAGNNGGVSLGLGLGGMLGNHVGIGTSVNIPLGRATASTAVAPTETLIYFDAHGVRSDDAVKNGFRRQIFAKQNNGDYLVQDFYEMGGSKRTEPMQLSPEQLHTFRTHPKNGTLTVYTRDGIIMQQQTFQNNQIIKSSHFKYK